jgi:hypothetical protein
MPERVTVIDHDAKTLDVRDYGAFSFLPGYHEELRGADLTTMGLRVGKLHWRKDSDIVVRMFVSRRQGEVIEVGVAVCPSPSDVAGCLTLGEQGAAHVAKLLGRELGTSETSTDGKTRAFVMR